MDSAAPGGRIRCACSDGARILILCHSPITARPPPPTHHHTHTPHPHHHFNSQTLARPCLPASLHAGDDVVLLHVVTDPMPFHVPLQLGAYTSGATISYDAASGAEALSGKHNEVRCSAHPSPLVQSCMHSCVHSCAHSCMGHSGCCSP